MTTSLDAARLLAKEAGIPMSANGHRPDADWERYTDWGLARRLVAIHGQDLRYCWPWAKWMTWSGTRWEPDTTGRIVTWCKLAIQGIYADALVAYAAATEAAAKDDKVTQKAAKEQADALYAWAVKSEATARISAAIDSARSEPGIPVTPEDFDADPWALNVQNGTLNSHTGQLRPHRREDLITKLAPVPFDPNAQLDLWDTFLGQAIPDAELRHYMQKAAGSSLTGEAPDDVLLFVYGPGGSGKGTFSDAMQSTLGEYATTAELSTFVTDKNSPGPRPDLAALRGVRMVVVEEVDDRQPGIIAMLKKASGGTAISTRSLHQETFSFRPQFKLWLLGNKRPRFPDDDSGLWRRFRVLPFTHVFDPADTMIRKALSTPAIAGPAILAWAMEGCLLWQGEGLGKPPKAVMDATRSYRDDLDPLKDWLADNTIEMPAAWAPFKDLYADYQSWARENGLRNPIGSKTFSQRLERRFKPHRGAKGIRGFAGVGLKTGAQLRGDTSQLSPIADVPVISQIESHMGENMETQIGVTLPEVSPEVSVENLCAICGHPVPPGPDKVYLADGVRHEGCKRAQGPKA